MLYRYYKLSACVCKEKFPERVGEFFILSSECRQHSEAYAEYIYDKRYPINDFPALASVLYVLPRRNCYCHQQRNAPQKRHNIRHEAENRRDVVAYVVNPINQKPE